MRVVRLLVSLLVLAAVVACAPKQGAGGPDVAFANYIKAYTGGVVSDGTTLRVELAAPVPMERQGDDLFKFKPALPGMSRWLSPTVVEFVPDGALKEDTVYEGSFQLGDVVDVSDNACKVFPFRFRAVPKTANLSLDGITIQNDARLQGGIQLSAPVALEDITLTVEPDTPVTLTGEGAAWRFETAGIARGSKDTPVTIRLKVKGFRDATPVKASIPATGTFKVIDTKITRTGNPCVEVRFSEPLAAEAASE